MSTIWTLHGFSEIGGALKFQQSLFQASFGDVAILCISGQSRARRAWGNCSKAESRCAGHAIDDRLDVPFIRQFDDVAEEPEVVDASRGIVAQGVQVKVDH